MAENQEPDVARRLGGGSNRGGVSGSADAMAQKISGAFKSVADNAAKAYKAISDMEKAIDRIDKKTRGNPAFGGGGGSSSFGAGGGTGKGTANAGGPRFGGTPSGLGGTIGGGGGGGSGIMRGALAAFGGGGGAGGAGSPAAGAAAAAAGAANAAPGGAAGGGMPGGGLVGKVLGPLGGAAFKAATSYGKAHLPDAATMELASSRLADSGGGNREYWRKGSGLARMGGYNLDDNVQSALTLSNLGSLSNPDDPGFAALQGQVKGITDAYGGVGATGAAQFLATGRSTQSIYAGRRIGIQTSGPGGKAMTPSDIAEQILKQYRGKNARGSAGYQADIASEEEQGGGIDQRIGALGYTGEQADMLRRTISAKAAGKEVGDEGNKLDEQTKNSAQAQMEGTSQTAKALADGAADVKHGGEMFRNAVNALLRGSHLGGVWGELAGASGQVGGPSSMHTSIGTPQQGGPAPFMQIEDAVRKLGFTFSPPTPGQTNNRAYGAHGAGLAVDFGDKTSDSAGIAKALVPYATGPNAAIQQLIYAKAGIGYDSGVNKGKAFYGPKTWAEHMDHVHVAVKPGVDLAAVVAAGPGSTAATAATPASSGGGGGARSAGIVNSAGDLVSEGLIGLPEGATEALLGGAPGASTGSAAAPAAAASGAGGGGAGPPAVGPLQDFAKKLLAQYGWSDQWDAFSKLEMSEGGWDPTVSNGETPGAPGHKGVQHNKAYGIPQALPPEKMASAGADWKTSGYTQLKWMMEYIKTKGTFHDPNSAWAFHQSHNSYAQGSWEIDRDQYARIHAGEMVVPADTAEQVRRASTGRGSGAPVTINVTVQNASEPEVMRLVQRVKTELSRDSVLDMIGAM